MHLVGEALLEITRAFHMTGKFSHAQRRTEQIFHVPNRQPAAKLNSHMPNSEPGGKIGTLTCPTAN